MKSMTGYGRAREQVGDKGIGIELRAVNHRYLDCTVKVPRSYGFLEEAVKREAVSRIRRGKVEIFVSVEGEGPNESQVMVNHSLVTQYVAGIEELANTYHLPKELTVKDLIRLPEIWIVEPIEPIETDVSDNGQALTETVLAVFEGAYREFDIMRCREGERLAADMRAHGAQLERLLERVEARAPERQRLYHGRLVAHMRDLLNESVIDENRLLSEAALYADRIAIDEETVRLRSHLHQLDLMVGEGGAVGRKLDFLIQEMNREVNTIGSKANDLAISRLVVEMKSELEKIREQVQNVE